jgi:hypothetical protein
MDKLIKYLKSCILTNFLVPNQFRPSEKGVKILNIDVSKFDVNKAISLLPKDKSDAGVTCILFEASFDDKTHKRYNASVFVGTPKALDETHIEKSFDNV